MIEPFMLFSTKPKFNPQNEGLSDLINCYPLGYAKLPIMTTLANLENITLISNYSEIRVVQSAVKDKLGCSAGCILISRMGQ